MRPVDTAFECTITELMQGKAKLLKVLVHASFAVTMQPGLASFGPTPCSRSLGDLTCIGSICKHDADSLGVLGD